MGVAVKLAIMGIFAVDGEARAAADEAFRGKDDGLQARSGICLFEHEVEFR